MVLPIQWNTKSNNTIPTTVPTTVPNNGHSQYCNNFNGNLNMWDYGIKQEYKNKLAYDFDNVGILAQFETVNSPYYTQVEVDPEYINYLVYLQNLKECNKRQRIEY
jgi:hypothetical protein